MNSACRNLTEIGLVNRPSPRRLAALSLMALAVLQLSLNSQAATQAATAKNTKKAPAHAKYDGPAADVPNLQTRLFDFSNQKDTVPPQRSMASVNGNSTEYTNSGLATNLVNIAKANIMDVEGLDRLLLKAETEYQNYKEPDTKFLAANLALLRAFRGSYADVGELLQESGVMQGMFFTAIRQSYTQAEEHRAIVAQLIFNYMNRSNNSFSQPLPGAAKYPQGMPEVVKFQHIVASRYYSAITNFVNRIGAISVTNAIPINLELFSANILPPGAPKFVTFSNADRINTLGLAEFMLMRTAMFIAHDYTDFIEYQNKIAMGFLHLPKQDARGLTDADRLMPLKENYTTLFNRLPVSKERESALTWSNTAFGHLTKAISYAAQNSHDFQTGALSHMQAIGTTLNFDIRAEYEKMKNEIAGFNGQKSSTILNRETGHTFTLNIGAIFDANAPTRSLLPQSLTGGDLYSDKQNKVINFNYKKANAWDWAAYQKIAPDMDRSNMSDLRLVQSILKNLGVPVASVF